MTQNETPRRFRVLDTLGQRKPLRRVNFFDMVIHYLFLCKKFRLCLIKFLQLPYNQQKLTKVSIFIRSIRADFIVSQHKKIQGSKPQVVRGRFSWHF